MGDVIVSSPRRIQEATQDAEERHVSTWSVVPAHSSERMQQLNSGRHRDIMTRLGRSRNPFLYNILRVSLQLQVAGAARAFPPT